MASHQPDNEIRISQLSRSPPARLKLKLNTAPSPSQSSNKTSQRSASPDRPSYSPVTPTSIQTSFITPPSGQHDSPQVQWMEKPPDPTPVSLEDNPDAMATSAAISILQMQRQQAAKDMRTLKKMKLAATDDPEAFVDDLAAGKLGPVPKLGIDVDNQASDDEEAEPTVKSEDSSFGRFPAAQNVVRAPPIEWAKYHIVGEPLERLHEAQRTSPGVKGHDFDGLSKTQPHQIASPYKPFSDDLNQTRAPP